MAFFFFCKAGEDIGFGMVTGVELCALPISPAPAALLPARGAGPLPPRRRAARRRPPTAAADPGPPRPGDAGPFAAAEPVGRPADAVLHVAGARPQLPADPVRLGVRLAQLVQQGPRAG